MSYVVKGRPRYVFATRREALDFADVLAIVSPAADPRVLESDRLVSHHMIVGRWESDGIEEWPLPLPERKPRLVSTRSADAPPPR